MKARYKRYKRKKKSFNKQSIYIIIYYGFKKFIFIFLLLFINNKFNSRIKNKYNYNTSNKFSNNTVHIAIDIDNKYIYPAIVYLTSLFDNKAKTTFYYINVITNGKLEKKNFEKINYVVDKFGNNFVKMIYHNIGDSFKGATTGHLPLTTYYKIALPSLLPNVDKIIFTDSDIINLEDLTEMYNFKFKEKVYFAGILDYINHLTQLRDFGLSSDKYINAGVLIMNLKAMREDSIEAKLREFVSNHTCIFWDQTAINCVCRNNIQNLPYKYNVFAFDQFYKLVELNNQQKFQYKYTERQLKKFFEEPTNFHYVSLDKPWLRSTQKFNRVYWWYYAKMSGFYKEILDYYNFNYDEIESLLKQIPNDGGLLKRNYKKIY